MTWATVADVLAITGQGAEVVDVAVADAVITIYANRTADAIPGLSTRDLYWLKQAVCWQCVWQREQPGYEARSVASSYSQDGLSATHSAEWNISLAPLAARSLKNLSWKGSRTLRTPDVRVPAGFAAALAFTNESSDWAGSEWTT
jgi:hypothetical protein